MVLLARMNFAHQNVLLTHLDNIMIYEHIFPEGLEIKKDSNGNIKSLKSKHLDNHPYHNGFILTWLHDVIVKNLNR